MSVRNYHPDDYETVKALYLRGDAQLDQRYQALGMTKGSAYTCFWQKTN